MTSQFLRQILTKILWSNVLKFLQFADFRTKKIIISSTKKSNENVTIRGDIHHCCFVWHFFSLNSTEEKTGTRTRDYENNLNQTSSNWSPNSSFVLEGIYKSSPSSIMITLNHVHSNDDSQPDLNLSITIPSQIIRRSLI